MSTPTTLEFTALHKVGFPRTYSGGKANYHKGALVSLDRKAHRALIECEGELFNVPMGDVRDLHRVDEVLAELRRLTFCVESIVMLRGHALGPAGLTETIKYLECAKATIAKAEGGK